MTQMKSAKEGVITDQMRAVALEENRDVEFIRSQVAKGEVVIPANINHKNLIGKGIGKGLKTKINTNFGMSKGKENMEYEIEKLKLSLKMDTDTVMDLSIGGDGFRPGSIHDATDKFQITELTTLGELTKRAWARDVQVMIEGPGHVPMDQIQANMNIQKTLCHNAPFYVLGPLVTDIGAGYDHITAAIGGALAAWHGADMLCYVTPAEHLRLPSLLDVREGIAATKIAAHAGDTVKMKKVLKNVQCVVNFVL